MDGFLANLGSSALSTVYLLAFALLPVLMLAWALQWISGHFRLRFTEMFGFRLGAWLTAPGVMLHEFSHALLCVVFRHRIDEFVLFSPQPNGTLGWVNHSWNERSIYQNIGNFFIGSAPIWFGSTAIGFVTLLCFPPEVFPFPDPVNSGPTAVAVQAWRTLFALLAGWADGHFLLRPSSWIWLYCVLAVGSHITLSPPDVAGAGSGVAALGAGVFAGTFLWRWLSPSSAAMPEAVVRLAGGVCGILLYVFLLLGVLTLLLQLSLAGTKPTAPQRVAPRRKS